MLALEVETAQISEMFQRFTAAIGDKHWCSRVRKCKEAIRGNVFLREYLIRENDIAFQLDHLSELAQRYGRIPLIDVENRAIYPAASFVAQALSIMDDATKENARRFRRRIHGALKNPSDMRGLQLELTAATHFARRGRIISWPETAGAGIFDLLVDGDGPEPLEVECKSIGDDKGYRIRRQDMIEFFALLKPHLQGTTKGLVKGLSVVVTVPDRLPISYKERVALAKELGRAVFAGSDCFLANGSSVQITDFDVSQLGNVPTHRCQEMRTTIDGITGTDNRSAVIIGTNAGGALVLLIQSQRDDSLLISVFKTLSDAAKNQLTRSRAGMLFVSFDGLASDELFSIAEQDQDPARRPTALRVAVSDFLSSPARDHVIGVGFVSRNAIQPVQHGLVESGSTAYYFPKRESLFWSEGFCGMFDWLPEHLLRWHGE